MSGPFPLPTSSLKTLFPGLVSRRRNLSWRSVQIGRWWSVQIGPRAPAGSLSLNDIMKWEELPATRPPANESHETASVSGACEGSEPGGKGGRGGGDLHSGREGDFNPSAPPPLPFSLPEAAARLPELAGLSQPYPPPFGRSFAGFKLSGSWERPPL